MQRFTVGQMDPKLAFERLQAINQAQQVLERKLTSSDYVLVPVYLSKCQLL